MPVPPILAPAVLPSALTFPSTTEGHHYEHANTSLPPETEGAASVTSLNRDSALALGILLILILIAISYFATSRLRAHKRAHQLAEQHRLSVAASLRGPRPAPHGITGYRIFKVDEQLPKGWEHWMHGASPSPSSVSKLPPYPEGGGKCSSLGALNERKRERRWWRTVVAHGTTTHANRDELPPLLSSPTLESVAYPSATARSFQGDVWRNEGAEASACRVGAISWSSLRKWMDVKV